MNFEKEIQEYGLNKETYEYLLADIDKKMSGELDIDWTELCDKYGLNCHPDTLRKASNGIFGGKFRADYIKNQLLNDKSDISMTSELDKKLSDIRKERIKLQTANVERNRIDRAEARQEMFYEYVGSVCETLPVPEFIPVKNDVNSDMEYVLTISDVHYGSDYVSTNNIYSPTICQQRFELLAGYVKEFIEKHNVSKLKVLELGDTLQGIIHISDLKLNDSSVVKSLVDISRIIANFLNEISKYAYIEYYHVNFANHTQMRNLGTKANEIAEEDLEYVIKNYIFDLCKDNKRIFIHNDNSNDQFLNIRINGFDTIVGHGHTLKGYKNALRDLSLLDGIQYSYCILGHFHGGDTFTSYEGITEDCETIVCPAFCGSDPYSDRLLKGTKSACQILGFDSIYGHTETYKFILN